MRIDIENGGREGGRGGWGWKIPTQKEEVQNTEECLAAATAAAADRFNKTRAWGKAKLESQPAQLCSNLIYFYFSCCSYLIYQRYMESYLQGHWV